jgi:addiction module HigA family antidote
MNETIETVGIKTPHVGAFIRDEILDELGLSILKAAEALGVRRATLSDLVNEKAALSPEMALRIEKAFGVKMDLLLKMQAGFDTENMRQHADEITVQPYSPSLPTP